MATDEHQIERHLTPHGWVAGNEWVNHIQIKSGDPPSDRIETWVEEISDSSEGWAPATTSSKVTWESPNVSSEQRAKLNQQFPRPEYKPWKPLPRKKRKLGY